MTPERIILLDGQKIMGQTFWGPSLEECTEMVQENYLNRLDSLTSVLRSGAGNRLRNPEVADGQIAELTQAAEKQFEERYRPLLDDFKDFYFNCWEGDIAAETAKLAESIGADFIIIGCHVRGDKPAQTRLGEVAHALFEWAPCPVMLVPCLLHRGNVTVRVAEALP